MLEGARLMMGRELLEEGLTERDWRPFPTVMIDGIEVWSDFRALMPWPEDRLMGCGRPVSLEELESSELEPGLWEWVESSDRGSSAEV